MQFSMQTVLGLVCTFSGIQIVLAQCPAGYGCVRQPPQCGEAGKDACKIMVTWMANNADGINFSFKAVKGTSPRWAAIGFSADAKMGDDDILLCRDTDAGGVVLEHYRSTGRPNLNIVKETSADRSQDGLTNIVESVVDGYATCSFTRAVAVAGSNYTFNLNETTTADNMPKYYLVAGTGPVTSNTPVQHENDPFHSPAGVNFFAAGEIVLQEGESSSESGEGTGTQIIASVMMLMIMACLTIALK